MRHRRIAAPGRSARQCDTGRGRRSSDPGQSAGAADPGAGAAGGERSAQQKQEEAIAAAVQWLCHEQELEQHLADQLAQRWRQLTAQAIEELLGKQDQNALLIRRINQLVIHRFAQGRLTLSVPPSAMTHAQAAWADSPRIAVTADPTLQEGQARLDDGLLRIHLDSQAQQSRLLQLLRDSACGRQYA
ncbi:hypothetical protein N4G58_18490 [Edwardsiella piscicida]|nr:hypothetical protein N4G58_18490 [Edwardsiella piscicida]